MKTANIEFLELSKYNPDKDIVIINVYIKYVPKNYFKTLSDGLGKVLSEKGFRGVFLPQYCDPPNGKTVEFDVQKEDSSNISNKNNAYDRAMKGM